MKPTDVFTAAEIAALLKRSNARGFIEICTTWFLIASAFAVVAFWPHAPTLAIPILIALVILGNRHLALAILVHDAGHHALFRSHTLNEFFGKWFAAAPALQDLHGYRTYHLQHHLYTGEDYQGETGDPDIILTRNYPISRKSFVKWILRDLTFRSGLRAYLGLAAMQLGIIRYDLSGRITMQPKEVRSIFGWISLVARKLAPFIITNAVLFAILFSIGKPWLYLLWIIAALTTFQVFLRIRSIAEHGMLPRVSDMLQNTRTTLASWWERLTFAPHHVNYHLEHHFLMGAPSYRLPQMHRLLHERGAFKHVYIAHGYADILRLAIRS